MRPLVQHYNQTMVLDMEKGTQKDIAETEQSEKL
jgi:hypothetical protein